MQKDKLTKLPSDKIKDILYEIYLISSNNEVLKRLNIRSLEFRNKINAEITEEGYILREKQLELQDRFYSEL